MLAVIVIMGVMAGALLLTADLSGAGGRHREQGRMLAALITRQCEEATLLATSFGVQLDAPGVRFLRWDGAAWVDRPDDRLFRPRSLDSLGEALLFVEGRDVTRADPDLPQIVCYASGELTPFTLHLTAIGGERVSVTGDALGTVSVDGDDE